MGGFGGVCGYRVDEAGEFFGMGSLMKETDRTFYRKFFAIYVVLVLQNVVTLSVNLADNMMLGAYSEISLSGVAAVNQIQFVFQQLLGALGDGLVILCSQYWGSRRIGPMKKIAATAMYTGLLIAALLFGMVTLFPHQAMKIFTNDEMIIGEGMKYLGDYPIYISVFCGDADSAGNAEKCGDCENRFRFVGYDVLCQLWD